MLKIKGNALIAQKNSEQTILCIICMTNYKNIMLHPCAHVVYCIECARNEHISDICPICRCTCKSAQIVYI